MNNFGNFSKLEKNYKFIRPSYPTRVIRDIYYLIKTPHPIILDLGCGTGISTRQMAKKNSRIFGCDIDEKMFANASKDKNITYIKGSAEKLPFPDKTFDLITMFAAFHWFSNKKAINEMRRVLKPKGAIYIVQQKHTSPFSHDHKEIISKVLGATIKTKYSKRKFEDVLAQNNFEIIENKIYKTINKYTLGQFLKLLQSYSIWNEVPVSKRKQIIKLFKSHFRTMLKNGLIHDAADLYLICAKPNL
ncbi:MAG: class I SAM-dependent methyltransferase [Patescibacteria group bacterium]